MSVHTGPNNSENGLVFYYDMGNTQKSWKGRPSRNYIAYTPNYVNWNSQDAVVSQISTEIQRISSASNIATDVIWWGGFNTGTADSATKISYSAYVRGQGTSYLQIHQVNTSPNTVAHMSISGTTITLDSSQWKRIEIKDIYQASGTASQNILVGLGAGVGNYVEVKNVQCEYQTFPSAYINPSLYTNGIRSNTQAVVDLTGNNTMTANSLTYDSDGSFRFYGSNYIDSSIASTNVYNLNLWLYNDYIIPANDSAIGGVVTSYQSPINFNRTATQGVNLGGWTGGATNEAVHIWSNTSTGGGWNGMTYTRDSVPIGWHNFQFNWNGSTYDIWIDGVKKTTYAHTSGNATLIPINAIRIGGDVAQNYFYVGKIPVVQIFNQQQSDDRVKANFNALRGRFGL